MQASNSAKIIPNTYNDISLDNCYGNCRCCLAIGQHSRILGPTEIHTFKEDLSIILSPDPRLPQFICFNCNSSLNTVQAFRLKVLASEEALLKIIGAECETVCQNDPLSTSEDISVKVEDDDFFCDQDGLPELPETDSRQLDLNKVKVENVTEEVKKRREDPFTEINQAFDTTEDEKSMKTEIKAIKISPDRIKKSLVKSHRKKRNSADKQDSDSDEIVHIQIGEKREIATEATKIRANITMLLQNSTAVPFRSKNSFQCFYCDNKYGTFQKLKEHTVNDHRNAKEFEIFASLRRVYRTTVHADITNLNCKICLESLQNIEELVQHLTRVHGKELHCIKEESKVPSHGIIAYKVDMESFLCHICMTPFRFLKYLVSHMHEHYALYCCTDCVKKFVTKERLKEHTKDHEQTETKCTDCHLIFDTRRLMLNHRYAKYIKTKQTKRVFKCPECPKTFPITKSLVRFLHMETEHNIKRPVYNCEHCGKNYKTIFSLNSHNRRVHLKKNQFVCDVCGYFTTEKTIMDRHVEHHNGVRNFECDLCHKKFRTKGNLKLHLRGHYNDKRFACSLCDAAFIQKHCLKSHVKSRHPDSGIVVSQL